jgi:hypothetical protein
MAKENNNSHLLRAGALILLAFSFLLNACNMPLSGWEYQFINQTKYGINITINEKYKLSQDKNAIEQSGSFSLYSHESKTLYGVKSGSVDFQWTASTWSNNQYIYSIPGGSKVTFKER